MSRWLPISSAPKDGTYILVGSQRSGGAWVAKWEGVYQSGYRPENPWVCMMLNTWNLPVRHVPLIPTHWMPLPEPPSDTDDLDAQLSPESLADVQAGRQVCRALYTGLAEVASLESLKPKDDTQ